MFAQTGIGALAVGDVVSLVRGGGVIRVTYLIGVICVSSAWRVICLIGMTDVIWRMTYLIAMSGAVTSSVADMLTAVAGQVFAAAGA